MTVFSQLLVKQFQLVFHSFTEFSGGIEGKPIIEVLPDQVSFSYTASAIYSQKLRSGGPETVRKQLLFFLPSDNQHVLNLT
jgi:hypothetical protein